MLILNNSCNHKIKYHYIRNSHVIIFNVILTSILISVTAYAQDPRGQYPNHGLVPNSNYALSDSGSVNLQNGNLTYVLPLASLPVSRGGKLKPSVSLVYNSKLYDSNVTIGKTTIANAPFRYFETNFVESGLGGWRYGTHYYLDITTRPTRYLEGAPAGFDEYKYKAAIVFPDGSRHEIKPAGWYETVEDYYNIIPGISGPSNYYSADSQYFRVNFFEGGWKINFPDGTTVHNDNNSGIQTVSDSNGNYYTVYNEVINNIQVTKIQDQVGRLITIERTSNEVHYVRVKGYGGIQDLVTTINIRTTNPTGKKFIYREYKDGAEYNLTRKFVKLINTINSIILPNGLSYQFDYNSNHYDLNYPEIKIGFGELSRITLPTGAIIQYYYSMDYEHGIGDSIDSGIEPIEISKNYVTGKSIIYDEVENGSVVTKKSTTSYQLEFGPSGTSPVETIVFNPDGGRTYQYYYDHTFGRREGMLYKTIHPDGTVTEKIWQNNSYTGMNKVFNDYVKTEFTSIPDSSGNLILTTIKDFTYDKNGNITQLTEYASINYNDIPRDEKGFPTGISTTAQPIRSTFNTFYNPTPTASDNTTEDPDIYIFASSPNIRNALESTEVRSGSGSVESRIERFYDSASLTGNLVLERKWDSQKGTYSVPLNSNNSISSSYQYSPSGSVTVMIDPNGVQTNYTYGDVNGHSDLYITRIISADNYASLKRTTDYSYDYYSGLVLQSTDIDNNVSTKIDYDVFSRPIKIRDAIGTQLERQTNISYSDVDRRIITRSDLSQIGDGKLISIQHFDQLMRIRMKRLLENGNIDEATDESKGVITQTKYHLIGQVSQTSNPYRIGEPINYTTINYDKVGRITSITSPDNAVVTRSYNGNQVSVTDQSGNTRRSQTDALGRLTSVTEDPATLNYKTDYSYDALGNLIQVSQGGQTRTFTYDSLSRLVSATNPESGEISYSYDSNGNLKQKTDARGVISTMTYDALNRVTSKTYSGNTSEATIVANATPQVNYIYDSYSTLPSGAPAISGGAPKGRLVGVSYWGGAQGTYYKHDSIGRITNSYQNQETSNYQTAYKYDLAGNLSIETRSNKRRTFFYYDQAARLTGFQTGTYPYLAIIDMVTGIQYTPSGAIQQETYGNGLVHKVDYNVRQQPTRIWLGHDIANPGSVSRIDYIYGLVDDVNQEDPYIHTYYNNGNIGRIKYYINGVLQQSQTFQYDGVNRLKYAVEHSNGTLSDSSRAWYQTFSYDRYGNRGIDVANTSDNADASNSALQLSDFDATNNRIARSGFTYDVSGNLISESGKSYTYDAESRIVTATVQGEGATQYVYDGNGRRVKKIVNGVGTKFEYGAGGELLTERNDSGSVTKDYLYRSGEMVATFEAGGTYKYATSDHLGSPRIWTDSNGNIVSRHDYLPFGEEVFAGTGTRTTAQGYASNTQADGQKNQFTGKARDVETGNDFFETRYYGGMSGRFLSPDPFWKDSNVADPQSWNKYVYARNNPLKYIDPTGERAKVTVSVDEENKTGTIRIEATIGIWTRPYSDISSTQMANGSRQIESSIEAGWSGTFVKDGITYTVTTDVSVQVFSNEDSAAEAKMDNVFEITNGPVTSDGGSGYVDSRNPYDDKCCYSSGYDKGALSLDHLATRTPAHEFGHGLGVEHDTNRAPNSLMTQTQYSSISRINSNDFNRAFSPEIKTTRSSLQPRLGWWRDGERRISSQQFIYRVWARGQIGR